MYQQTAGTSSLVRLLLVVLLLLLITAAVAEYSPRVSVCNSACQHLQTTQVLSCTQDNCNGRHQTQYAKCFAKELFVPAVKVCQPACAAMLLCRRCSYTQYAQQSMNFG